VDGAEQADAVGAPLEDVLDEEDLHGVHAHHHHVVHEVRRGHEGNGGVADAVLAEDFGHTGGGEGGREEHNGRGGMEYGVV